MSRYLVTGGCGFIGSHLCDALVAAGHRVRILDNLSSGLRRNAPARAELIIGDVADRIAVRDAMQHVDGVFHLAAVSSVERSNDDWIGTHATNLTGCITVLDAARDQHGTGPTPVIFASSAAVYGDKSAMPLTEDEAPQPLTAYGVDKLGCELHARVAASIHGVPTTGLRFFNVYGPRQNSRSPYSGVISIFCERLLAGDALPIDGDGEQIRDFIHVSDVVRLLMQAIPAPAARGEILNVCTGTGISILGLAALLADLCDKPLDVIHRPARPGDVRVSVGEASRARRRYGFTPAVALRDGLRDTLAAARGPETRRRRSA